MDLKQQLMMMLLWLPALLAVVQTQGAASAGPAKYNAALLQRTWQSSLDWEGNSSNAVDGNTDGDFDHGSCTHTDNDIPQKSTIWWSVDLGAPRRVQSVKLFNRVKSGQNHLRLQKFSIYGTIDGHAPNNATGKTDCANQDAPLGAGASKDFVCKQKVLSRYIIVEKERLTNRDNNILTLCEAEVYVCRDQNCANCTEDTCLVCDSGYDRQNGVCTAGPAKYNAALLQRTWQSSLAWEGISSKAVDGNTDGDFDHGSCTHTDILKTSTIWWSVDLGTPRRVQSVKLYNRVNNGQRLQKFSIYGTIDGHAPNNASGKTDCAYQDAPLGTGASKDFVCKQKVLSRYIIVEKERLTNRDHNILTLCEAEVYVCLDQNCADCTEDRCLVCDSGYDKQNGVCIACYDGTYGYGCAQRCPSNCRHTRAQRCNHITGFCGRCADGFEGSMCDIECRGGRYGYGCRRRCPSNCRNTQKCDHVTGHCPACADGFRGDMCEHACPLGSYGEDCAGVCSEHCMNSDSNNCHNINGSCPSCQPGYQGDKCDSECSRGRYGQDCSETCPENCKKSGVCDHIDGHCDCGEGYKGDACKDQCSVEAYEYGVNCKSRCSPHCGENGTCSVKDGACDAEICKPGYVGKYCSKAIGGQYVVITVVVCTCAVVLAIVATGFVVLMILRRRRMEGPKPDQLENRADTKSGQQEKHTETGNPDVMYLTLIEGEGNNAGLVDDSQAYEDIAESDLQDAIPQNEEECEYILPGEGVYQGIPKAAERDLYANSDITVYQPLQKAATKKPSLKKAASKKVETRKPFRST